VSTRAAKPVAVLLVAALAFAAALAGIEWHRAHRAQSRLVELHASEADRAAASATAAELASALFTFDYHDLQATQDTISRLGTGAFAQREGVNSAAVQRQLLAAHAVSTAKVSEETVSQPSGDHATALIVLSTHATSAGGQSSTNEIYLHLYLVKVDGDWKVYDVRTLKPAS
jgi:hypothetical protein